LLLEFNLLGFLFETLGGPVLILGGNDNGVPFGVRVTAPWRLGSG
jgi:hypothetical protein